MSSLTDKVADLTVTDKETETVEVEEDEKEDGLTEAERAKKREANRKKKEKAKQKKKDAAAATTTSGVSSDSVSSSGAVSPLVVDLSSGFDKLGMHHFFNDTTSTMLKYNKQKARHVVARKNIDAGDVSRGRILVSIQTHTTH
jgi:hypothetical protein